MKSKNKVKNKINWDLRVIGNNYLFVKYSMYWFLVYIMYLYDLTTYFIFQTIIELLSSWLKKSLDCKKFKSVLTEEYLIN